MNAPSKTANSGDNIADPKSGELATGSTILSPSGQDDWSDDRPMRRVVPRLNEMLDDAVRAWMDIERRVIASDEDATSKDGKALIYAFVYNAVAFDPANLVAINTNQNTGKPVVTIKAGTNNADYLLPTKLAWHLMRKAMGADVKKARNSYNRYAKAFRWAGEKGYSYDQFRAALDDVGITKIEDEYDQHFGSGRDGPTERKAFKLARLKQFAEVGDMGAGGLKAPPGEFLILIANDAGKLKRIGFRIRRSKLDSIISDGDVTPVPANENIGLLALPVPAMEWLKGVLEKRKGLIPETILMKLDEALECSAVAQDDDE